MKWLLQIHRALSGLSLLVLTMAIGGLGIPKQIVDGILMATLGFYLGELLLMTVVAITNIKKLDIVFPLVMLLTTGIAVRGLLSNNFLPALIPVVIMFITGYMAEGESREGSRIRESEQS